MLPEVQAGSPAKVLIVDDEPANLLALEAVLDELGAQLVSAGSGEQALARTLQDDFAAILLDLRMPGMDGFETARLIRSRARSRSTPILFITAAEGADALIEQAYALGATDLLAKPLQATVLKAKVSFFIELHRSREELRQAERRAVNERAFLAAVLEAVEDGIVACDASGKPTLINRATRELLGLPLDTLQPGPWAQGKRLQGTDARSALAAHEMPLARALAGERVSNAELVARAADGRSRTLLASGQPLCDTGSGQQLGAVLSLHDVTAQREAATARELAVREQARRETAEAAAERLRISEERYRTLFETMDEGFCVIEMLFDPQMQPRDFRFIEANPAYSRHTGLEDVAGRCMSELKPGTQPRWLSACGEVALTGRGQRLLHHMPGSDRWFDVSVSRLGGADSRRLVLLASEVTERVRAERVLRQLADELAESDRRKTEFLAVLAHELRNPLAPLRNGLHLLRHAKDDRSRERTWDMMDRQLGHMVCLIDDLLDIARVSSGKLELKRRPSELRRLVASAVEITQPQIDAAAHALSLALPAEPLWLDADPTRVTQVLANLVSNAAKYTPRGGRICLTARRDGDQVVLAVEDDGIGILPNDLPRVFQMFTQVGRDSHDAPGGLGIGLALVQSLVRMHGGSIEAHSRGRGCGSTFTLRLPLLAPVCDAIDGDSAEAQGQPGAGRSEGPGAGGSVG